MSKNIFFMLFILFYALPVFSSDEENTHSIEGYGTNTKFNIEKEEIFIKNELTEEEKKKMEEQKKKNEIFLNTINDGNNEPLLMIPYGKENNELTGLNEKYKKKVELIKKAELASDAAYKNIEDIMFPKDWGLFYLGPTLDQYADTLSNSCGGYGRYIFVPLDVVVKYSPYFLSAILSSGAGVLSALPLGGTVLMLDAGHDIFKGWVRWIPLVSVISMYSFLNTGQFFMDISDISSWVRNFGGGGINLIKAGGSIVGLCLKGLFCCKMDKEAIHEGLENLKKRGASFVRDIRRAVTFTVLGVAYVATSLKFLDYLEVQLYEKDHEFILYTAGPLGWNIASQYLRYAKRTVDKLTIKFTDSEEIKKIREENQEVIKNKEAYFSKVSSQIINLVDEISFNNTSIIKYTTERKIKALLSDYINESPNSEIEKRPSENTPNYFSSYRFFNVYENIKERMRCLTEGIYIIGGPKLWIGRIVEVLNLPGAAIPATVITGLLLDHIFGKNHPFKDGLAYTIVTVGSVFSSLVTHFVTLDFQNKLTESSTIYNKVLLFNSLLPNFLSSLAWGFLGYTYMIKTEFWKKFTRPVVFAVMSGFIIKNIALGTEMGMASLESYGLLIDSIATKIKKIASSTVAKKVTNFLSPVTNCINHLPSVVQTVINIPSAIIGSCTGSISIAIKRQRICTWLKHFDEYNQEASENEVLGIQELIRSAKKNDVIMEDLEISSKDDQDIKININDEFKSNQKKGFWSTLWECIDGFCCQMRPNPHEDGYNIV